MPAFQGLPLAQMAVTEKPPSTTRLEPVMKLPGLASEARSRAAPINSSAFAETVHGGLAS